MSDDGAFNKTSLRFRTLKAVEEGRLTAILCLSMTPQATRTLDALKQRGLVEYGRDAYQLTASGVDLLAKWDRSAEGGVS